MHFVAYNMLFIDFSVKIKTLVLFLHCSYLLVLENNWFSSLSALFTS